MKYEPAIFCSVYIAEVSNVYFFLLLGVFIYPLGEKEVVVGFEAAIAGRLVGVQIQSRGKLECCLDCCPGSGLESQCGSGLEWSCCGSSGLDAECSNGEQGQ